jgi:type III restriction enzyme
MGNGTTIVLEIKGRSHEDTDAKHQAARRWVSAVNNWGKLGRWDFLVCRDPQKVPEALADSFRDRVNSLQKLESSQYGLKTE